ncbi:MAG TPA: DUF3500 domain-containing protein [Gemmataceae bacterium]|nr:DUF3500 domain-containing protein [Gemmataceae bacterium]
MRLRQVWSGVVAVGIIGAAVVLGRTTQPAGPKAEPPQPSPSAGARMAEAAQALLAGLSDEQRAKAAFAFDDPVRLTWHYYPITPEPRKGAVLKEMTAREKELVKGLLRAGTSKEGYETALQVMALDGILRDIENTEWARRYRDPELYYVCVFGKPGLTGKWGWRIEGHHLSLNYVLENGRVVSVTPLVFGANPAEVPSGPHRGLRVLAREEDLARRLYTSLDRAARQKATVADRAPFDVFTEVKPQPKRLPLEGLAFADMKPPQRELAEQLLRVYAGKLPGEAADRLLQEAAEAGLERVHFAWAGGPQPGQPHYYRLQGPTFVVEYCNTQNRANHIHALWRSYTGDFGIPMK